MKSKLIASKKGILASILSLLILNIHIPAFAGADVIALSKEPEIMTFLFVTDKILSSKGHLSSLDFDRIDSAIAFISQSPNDFEAFQGTMTDLLARVKTLLMTQGKSPFQIKQDRKKALAAIDEFLGHIYGE